MHPTAAVIRAVDIAARIQSGQATAVEVVREHLGRIAALDEDLGAFQLVRGEPAMAEATELDARADRATLPLAGVPVAVKDCFDVAGEPTRLGTAATSASPAECDDELVRRLREAGCIVIGKTRMPELAIWGFTSSAAFGVTRNPWDRNLDPGGSSGGAAVAVATGMAALSLGSDGGGSIRIPAAYCGVFGLKPGSGVLPLPGGHPEHWYGLSSCGPLTRTVADAAAMLAVLRGEPAGEPVAPGRLRVAMSVRSPSPVAQADDHNRRAVLRAGRQLDELGHRVTIADPPYSPLLMSRWTRHWHAGIAQDAHGLPASKLEPRTRVMAAKGRRVQHLGGPRRGVATAWRQKMISWLEDYDVLLTPSVAAGPIPAGCMDGRGYVSTLLKSAAAVPFTGAWNLAGLPAAAIPIGVSGNRPRSVQLIGRPGSEALLLSLAAQLEEFIPPG